MGRFISADSIVPGAGNPQALNRYAYTKNNPLRYIDPSGHGDEQPTDYLSSNPDDPSWNPPDPANEKGAGPTGGEGDGTGGGGDILTDGSAKVVIETGFNDPSNLKPGWDNGGAVEPAGTNDTIRSDFVKARSASDLVGNTGRGNPTIASTSDGELMTHSGWGNHPGYPQATSDVLKAADDMGIQFEPHYRDPVGQPGLYNASHAETQLAVSTSPGEPFGVSNNMCDSCKSFISSYGKTQGATRVVADPSNFYIFGANGSIGVVPR